MTLSCATPSAPTRATRRRHLCTGLAGTLAGHAPFLHHRNQSVLLTAPPPAPHQMAEMRPLLDDDTLTMTNPLKNGAPMLIFSPSNPLAS